MTQFHSGKETTGLCIYCSDPRAPLWKNIKKHLILPGQHFAAIGILGGPISLANATEIPVQFAALMEQIEFALHAFDKVNEFIAVSHDCGFYAKTRRSVALQDKKDDVTRACEFLEKRFGKPARGYFANHSHENFSFEGVGEVTRLV